MSDLILEQTGSISRITINRPANGNMLTLALVSELAGMIAKAAALSHAVLVAGAGADFCRGRDPTGGMPAGKSPMELRNLLIAPILGLYDAIRNAPVPVIARVQGRATGLGCAIAGVCDIAVASEDAIFQLPEMEKNLPPTLAMSALLDRVGKKAVTWLVCSTDAIGAKRALDLGIVSEVVSAAQLDAALDKLTNTLASRTLVSVRAVKEYIAYAPENGPAVASMAGNLLAAALASNG